MLNGNRPIEATFGELPGVMVLRRLGCGTAAGARLWVPLLILSSAASSACLNMA